MDGWHHRLDGHEFEQAPGVGDGQGGLACCDSWGQLLKRTRGPDPSSKATLWVKAQHEGALLIPKKGNAKECSNYCTIALISHASKVMLKILQARLKQYVNHELPDVQAGFRKGTLIKQLAGADQVADRP